MFGICSKLIIKTAERCRVLIFNFEQISFIVLVSLLFTLNKLVPAGYVFHRVRPELMYNPT